jgi:hypothetical protein
MVIDWSRRGIWLTAILCCIAGCDAGKLVGVPDAGPTGDTPSGHSDSNGSSDSNDNSDSNDDRDVLFSTLDDDADADGVIDADDACDDTPAGEIADEFGCSCSQLDSDSDGVNDCDDGCPNNSRKLRAGATIVCDVSFDDPARDYAAYYPAIELNVVTACEAWTKHMVALRDVSIEVEVRIADISTAVASSKTVARIRSEDGLDTYEQGAVSEIRTGIDPNDDVADAVVTIGQRNLTDGLWWFDPDPSLREAPLPEDLIDAYSAFLHEMGHVFAYNGWKDFQDGELPGNYLSTFDEYIVFDGANFFFAGEHAVAEYGGPVPLTYGNIAHVANSEPRPGSDLLEELMNGVVTRRGKRRDISPIDLAILADVGAPMQASGTGLGCEDLPAATRPAPPLIVGPTPDLQERPLPPQQHRVGGHSCGCSR